MPLAVVAMSQELYVEIDGVMRPLYECHWVRLDPVGCAISSLLGDCAASMEQAWKEFVPLVDDRQAQLRLGYTVVLVDRERWQRDVEACMRSPRLCDHEPPAGIKTCYLCARIGTIGFAEIEPVPHGGTVTVCRQAAACRKRRGPDRSVDN